MKDQHLVYNYHIRMIKKIGLVIVLASCSFVGVGQNQYADSLEVILATTTNPVDRFDLLNHILLDITSYRGSNIDSAATLHPAFPDAAQPDPAASCPHPCARSSGTD